MSIYEITMPLQCVSTSANKWSYIFAHCLVVFVYFFSATNRYIPKMLLKIENLLQSEHLAVCVWRGNFKLPKKQKRNIRIMEFYEIL